MKYNMTTKFRNPINTNNILSDTKNLHPQVASRRNYGRKNEISQKRADRKTKSGLKPYSARRAENVCIARQPHYVPETN
jgi:hypothetical protein